MPVTRKGRRSTQAALQVLTDPSLFQSIVQFSTGVSYDVFQVKEQLECARKWTPYRPAEADVALWQNAVCAGDRRTLEALQTLGQVETLGERVQQVQRGILAFALTHTKDWELLAWIDDPDHFPDEDHSEFSRRDNRQLGEHGDVEIIQWLKDREFTFSDELLVGAASKGHVVLVEFLLRDDSYRPGSKTETVSHAAANGHLAVVKLLLANQPGDVMPQGLMHSAVKGGHLDVVQYFHENAISECTARAVDEAAASGHLDVITYLHANELGGCTTAAVDGAAANGHLEVVRFLLENRDEGGTRKAALSALQSNRIDILKLLCEHQPIDTISCALPLAAELGNVALVAYLYDKADDIRECRIPREDLVNRAASSGRLDLIRFFHAHDYFRFSVKAMHNAAVHNHLPIVKFLHEHRIEGCKVDTLFECEARKHAKVVDFLCSHRPMAKPESAIARAKRENRMLLAAKIDHHSCGVPAPGARTKTLYEYRRL
ncbi:hypothetical protein PybrP1_002989 [[Pythium] brassicae (nom. inval.)]|nr:hypothetical protein PybrP1_002989 [[Pythium] brassicae (nom. inval.)]